MLKLGGRQSNPAVFGLSDFSRGVESDASIGYFPTITGVSQFGAEAYQRKTAILKTRALCLARDSQIIDRNATAGTTLDKPAAECFGQNTHCFAACAMRRSNMADAKLL